MSWIASAVIGGSVISGVGGYLAQKGAAEEAAGAQRAASEAAIAEQRRQQAEAERLLAPYMQAGQGALAQQQALLGLAGPEAQQAAIDQLSSQMDQAMFEQGEAAILQNASATGGLRGGNTQAALAQFRPAMLSQLIQQQMSALGGLAGMGQQGAMGAAGMGQQGAANVGNLLTAQGQAAAGSAMAQGQGMANLFGGVGGALGTLGGLGAMGRGPFAGGGGAGGAGSGYTPGMGAAGVTGMNFNLG